MRIAFRLLLLSSASLLSVSAPLAADDAKSLFQTHFAGVAGGMLLANSIGGLFRGHNDPLGMNAKAGESQPQTGGGLLDKPYGSGGLTEAQQREQDRLQDEDQDQDMEQDEEDWADDDDGGDSDY